MAGVRRLTLPVGGVLEALLPLVEWDGDRATGYLPGSGWLNDVLDMVEAATGVRFPIVAFQAYRNGSGCVPHVDDPFGDQWVLSLGVSRTFQMDGEQVVVSDGDLTFVPAGCVHGIVEEDVAGVRCSLVFRKPR